MTTLLVVGWVVCGVLAWTLTFGYFQWHHKDLGYWKADAALSTFNAMLGPMGLFGALPVCRPVDAWSYWKHGRKSQREVYPSVPSITFGSFGSALTASLVAHYAPGGAWQSIEKATPPPVEETWTPEPVLAWRWWSLNLYDLTLSGAVAVWESGRMEARHRPGLVSYAYEDHADSPHPDCLCGVNALKATAVHEYLADPPQGIDVVGRVALTGVVDEYEKGYRAEKAEIVELVIPADLPLLRVASEPILDALQTRYGVRPTIQPRESWLAEMEVIHGLGKENSSDRIGAGGSPAGGTSGAGQGASQAGLSPIAQARIYYQITGQKPKGLGGVTDA